jgi:hypothetical protein
MQPAGMEVFTAFSIVVNLPWVSISALNQVRGLSSHLAPSDSSQDSVLNLKATLSLGRCSPLETAEQTAKEAGVGDIQAQHIMTKRAAQKMMSSA